MDTLVRSGFILQEDESGLRQPIDLTRQSLKIPLKRDGGSSFIVRQMRHSQSTGLKIRPEQPSDYQAIASVNTIAFGQENEAKLVESIRNSPNYIPQLSLVAELDGAIIGHIMFSYVDLVGEDKLSILALAPMAVLLSYQNQGVGSKLVKAGLEAAEAIDAPLVVVLGHSWFYSKFGMKRSRLYNIEPSFPVPEEAFMVKTFKSYQEKYQGKVVYPPYFGV